jgi:tetratricopeptide (TPR) repeat protein
MTKSPTLYFRNVSQAFKISVDIRGQCEVSYIVIILRIVPILSPDFVLSKIFTLLGQNLLSTIPNIYRRKKDMSEELYKKGLSHAKIEDYEEAIRYFDKAVQLDPNNALAWISKANALIEYGNDEEARKCLERAKKLDPKYDYDQTLTNRS